MKVFLPHSTIFFLTTMERKRMVRLILGLSVVLNELTLGGAGNSLV